MEAELQEIRKDLYAVDGDDGSNGTIVYEKGRQPMTTVFVYGINGELIPIKVFVDSGANVNLATVRAWKELEAAGVKVKMKDLAKSLEIGGVVEKTRYPTVGKVGTMAVRVKGKTGGEAQFLLSMGTLEAPNDVARIIVGNRALYALKAVMDLGRNKMKWTLGGCETEFDLRLESAKEVWASTRQIREALRLSSGGDGPTQAETEELCRSRNWRTSTEGAAVAGVGVLDKKRKGGTGGGDAEELRAAWGGLKAAKQLKGNPFVPTQCASWPYPKDLDELKEILAVARAAGEWFDSESAIATWAGCEKYGRFERPDISQGNYKDAFDRIRRGCAGASSALQKS